MSDKGKISAREFFEMSMRPGMGDKMVFEMAREDDGLFFSMEAYEDLALQFQRFLMARHVAAGKTQGKLPNEMHVRVSISWWRDPVKEIGDPWYSAEDSGPGLEVIEGERRKKGE